MHKPLLLRFSGSLCSCWVGCFQTVNPLASVSSVYHIIPYSISHSCESGNPDVSSVLHAHGASGRNAELKGLEKSVESRARGRNTNELVPFDLSAWQS